MLLVEELNDILASLLFDKVGAGQAETLSFQNAAGCKTFKAFDMSIK